MKGALVFALAALLTGCAVHRQPTPVRVPAQAPPLPPDIELARRSPLVSAVTPPPASQRFTLTWDWPWIDAQPPGEPLVARARWGIEWSSNAVNWTTIATGKANIRSTNVAVPWSEKGFFRIGAYCLDK
jgi:hypothetical protein